MNFGLQFFLLMPLCSKCLTAPDSLGKRMGDRLLCFAVRDAFGKLGCLCWECAAEKLLTGIKQLLGIRYRKMIDAVRVLTDFVRPR